MNSFSTLDDKLIFDTCEHITEYKDNCFYPVVPHDTAIPIGFDKDGKQHILWLCRACGERMERQSVLNFLGKIPLTLVVNQNKFELKSPNAWMRFRRFLNTEEYK